MTKKLVMFFAAALFSAVAFAGPKTYDVVISKAMVAGTSPLAPGEYKVALQDGKATFTRVHSHDSLTVPVKVETAKRKFDSTELDTRDQNGVIHLSAIRLGGSNNTLEFGQ